MFNTTPTTRLTEHRQRIQTLAAAGLPIPGKWTKLNAQLDDFLELQSPIQDRLIQSVLTPSAGDDRPSLRALALAEQAGHQAVAAVNNRVINAVIAKLIDTITAAAPDIYAKAAAMFDATANAFTAAASVVDPETSAVLMVNESEVRRTAWSQATDLAAKLTTLTKPLATAASLAGVQGFDPDINCDPVIIPLVVDTTGLHRRRLWERWVTKPDDGRSGRWGSLVALGAPIRALPNLAEHQPYAEPKPLEHRKVQVRMGEYRTEIHDPHDSDYRPPAIDGRRQGRVTAV